jgi:osmotically-inducible protein OsmY
MRTIHVALLGLAVATSAAAQERKNYFDDPFQQVTSALPSCAVPRPPGMTESELRDAAHVRAQAGVSCYTSGRCRLPNSYLYDKEIAARMPQYIHRDGRFEDTSLWVLVERRYVYLKGCVRTPEQAEQLEKSVALVDDVMGVINELSVGTSGPPRYATAP